VPPCFFGGSILRDAEGSYGRSAIVRRRSSAGIETVALMARGALDEAQKPQVMQRRQALFEGRYDLSNRPIANVTM
jgi:hypothetical protein